MSVEKGGLAVNTDALKPCPFCGSKAANPWFNDDEGFGRGEVYCTCCSATAQGSYQGWMREGDDEQQSINEAVTAWNARASLPATDAQVLANEEVFMDETWSALKADATDLRKQQRILKAYRSATSGQNFSNEKVQALVEALEETQNDASFFQQSGISQTAMSAAFDRIHNRARAALAAMEDIEWAKNRIEELEDYIEQLEQTIKNMTAHIRIDPDE